jgi:hypothetical protein
MSEVDDELCNLSKLTNLMSALVEAQPIINF